MNGLSHSGHSTRSLKSHLTDAIFVRAAMSRDFSSRYSLCRPPARLAALAYPTVSKGMSNRQLSPVILTKVSIELLRIGSDLMNLFFVIDEYTDVEDAAAVRMMVDIIIDAINNPEKPRPEGEILLGELSRQYIHSRCTRVQLSSACFL